MPVLVSAYNAVKQTLTGMVRLFYPSLCAACGKDLIGTDRLICIECLTGLPLTGFYHHRQNPVEKIFRGRLPLAYACAYLYFTKNSRVQNLLHELKYKGNKEVGVYFGRQMGMAFQKTENYNQIEALIPLPLFYSREKQRGYNQAKVICEGIAEVMNIPVLDQAVRRINATQTQTQKNRTQRWDNIQGKFDLRYPELIQGKKLLLVDDVVTTGASLEACGQELIKSPGTLLSIATLAYTSL